MLHLLLALLSAATVSVTVRTVSTVSMEIKVKDLGLQAEFLSPSADTVGGEGFVWGSYDGPEGSRRYKLYVPAKIPSGPRRLLVMLHGCTQDPDDFARGTRMNSIAGEQGFLVLYPEQPATANPLKCWNWFAAAHQKRGEGEPAILAGMIRRVVEEQKIDPSKVYLAGISAGGAMAAILGATYPELFSGLAIHSGIAYGLATDMTQGLAAMRAPEGDAAALGKAAIEAMGERRKPIPVIIVQGTKDPSVNPTNGGLLASQWRAVNGLEETVAPILHFDGEGGRYSGEHVSWRGSNPKSIVDLWAIADLGHAWSGGSKDGTFTDDKGPNISQTIIDFFLAEENSQR